MMTKEIRALRKSPIINSLRLTVKLIFEKSGFPPIAAIRGVMRSSTKAVTTAPKATPITTPTARSTTFPFKINCLNPFNTNCIFAQLFCFCKNSIRGWDGARIRRVYLPVLVYLQCGQWFLRHAGKRTIYSFFPLPVGDRQEVYQFRQ